MRGLAGKFALGMFLDQGRWSPMETVWPEGIDDVAGGGSGGGRDPDQYLADFANCLVRIRLALFGNLIPIGPDSPAMWAIGVDCWGSRPGGLRERTG